MRHDAPEINRLEGKKDFGYQAVVIAFDVEDIAPFPNEVGTGKIRQHVVVAVPGAELHFCKLAPYGLPRLGIAYFVLGDGHFVNHNYGRGPKSRHKLRAIELNYTLRILEL